MSILTQTYPADKKLSIDNFSIWEEHMFFTLTQFTTIGISIIKQIPYLLVEPTLNDFIGTTNIRKYSFKERDLTTESRRDFRLDCYAIRNV